MQVLASSIEQWPLSPFWISFLQKKKNLTKINCYECKCNFFFKFNTVDKVFNPVSYKFIAKLTD